MLRTTLTAIAMCAGISFLAAPIAAATADDMTNHDVSAAQRAEGTPFVPYKVKVPEPASGGQGPNDPSKTLTPPFDDGLSDSSRDMLNRVNAAYPPG